MNRKKDTNITGLCFNKQSLVFYIFKKNNTMKKLLLLFTILTILSCSKDDDTANNDNTNGDTNVLIKKITENYDDGSTTYVYVADYVYDENKIVSIKEYMNDNLIHTHNFTYTNNLISSYNSINESNANITTTLLTYDNNNRIIEHTFNLFGQDYTDYYTYNGNTVSSDDCMSMELQNNQIISFTEYNDDCQTIFGTISITYDNNKNAFSNIEGYSWYSLSDHTFSQYSQYKSGVNNITSITSTEPFTSLVTLLFELDYAYDYNENGYPRNVTVTEDGSLVSTLTIEYY